MKKFALLLIVLIGFSSFSIPEKREVPLAKEKFYKIKSVLGFTRFTVRFEGKIELNEDKTKVKSISKGGYLIFEKKGLFKSEKIVISESKGVMQNNYYLNGNSKKFQLDEAKLLREFIRETIQEVVFAADNQIESAYNFGGINSVFSFVNSIEKEDLRTDYILAFTEKDYKLNNQHLFFNFVNGSITSDFYKSKIIAALIANNNPLYNPDNFFLTINAIDSDFRKSELLIAMLVSNSAVSNPNEYLKVIGSMRNDFYKAKSYSYLSKKLFSNLDLKHALYSIKGVKSDYYKAESLIAFTPMVKADINNYKNPYLDVCTSISSDTYYNKAVNALK